jgi:hypothetical protein
MRRKSGLPIAGMLTMGIPMTASASIIAQYNMGNTSGTVSLAATTLDPNATATSLTPGSTTVVSNDPGVSFYTSQPGPNMISVAEASSTASDTGYSESFTVTANAGFVLDPTSFTLDGGKGGSSNIRSAYIYDSVDGFPTAEIAPPFTGGDLLNGPSGTAFTPVRSTSAAIQVITVSLPADDLNQNSFTITVWFDTQAQVAKNIDLGLFELDGSVVAVPEPSKFSLLAIPGLICLGARRRRNSSVAG